MYDDGVISINYQIHRTFEEKTAFSAPITAGAYYRYVLLQNALVRTVECMNNWTLIKVFIGSHINNNYF
jgi:hypothetical protein